MLKISPDLDDSFIDSIVGLSLEKNINGIILTNTTNSNRENIISTEQQQSNKYYTNKFNISMVLSNKPKK